MAYLEDNLKIFPQATNLPIILGSSSSNRQFVLSRCGWHFDVMVPDIDEKAIRNPDPYLLPVIIAKAKATAILSRLDVSRGPFVLLTADQIVLYGSEVREKPINEAQAMEFLSSYSEREVSTVSAVVATHYPSGVQSHEVARSTVSFGYIDPHVVEKVIARGQIYSSAGGFRIEDEDLNPLILHIDGTVDSILGMPMEATVRVIRAATCSSA